MRTTRTIRKHTVKWTGGLAAAGMLVTLAASGPATAAPDQHEPPEQPTNAKLPQGIPITFDLIEGEGKLTIDGKSYSTGQMEGAMSIVPAAGACHSGDANADTGGECPTELLVADVHFASAIGQKTGGLGQLRMAGYGYSDAEHALVDAGIDQTGDFTTRAHGLWITAERGPDSQAIALRSNKPVALVPDEDQPTTEHDDATTFPPQGTTYALDHPVELVDPENPEAGVVAVLESFNAIASHQ
ncbi:hypothetical protein [Glycomyces sp. NPDC048151]|uniref:hypothetical protein n=1 Tax=Glycomyces sp. NPDC048151 TaxID=3364002 RepID=UPI00371A3296